MKKNIMMILALIFILIFPIFLMLVDVQLVAFDRDFYYSEFKKYNIPEQLNIEFEELMTANEKTINYLEGKRDDLNFKAVIAGSEQEFFSEKDKLHMIDVRYLFDKGKLIRNISFAYIICFVFYGFISEKNFGKKLAKYCLISSLLYISLIAVLALLMSIDFYKYFTIFHEIFFNNDLWLLDPSVDRLVNIYPEAFFTDTAFRISKFFAIELALTISISAFKIRGFRR